MEPGNDPGRDEYGLPPVDVEIPDDARDLDRDVQAYHRELRARRRRVRIRRLTGPLTRHGLVLPLVAACLALTLLTGSLLTVLSGRQVPLLRSRLSPAPTQGASANRGRQLPDVQVSTQGHYVALRDLAVTPAVLAWVPSGCLRCGRVLRQLARRATQQHVPFYFVGYYPTIRDLSPLLNQVGPKYRNQFVNDTSNALVSFYRLAGVTAILAHSGGWVQDPDVVRGLSRSSGLRTFNARLALLADSGAAAGASSPAQQPAPRAS